MTKDEQITFIKELIDNVEDDILTSPGRIKESWGVRELCQYVADLFYDRASAWRLYEQLGAEKPPDVDPA
jgi:hypothetical protein